MKSQDALTESAVRAALTEVSYPGLNRDVVSFGMLRTIKVVDGSVHVSLLIASTRQEVLDQLRTAISEKLATLGALHTEVEIVPPERHAPSAIDPWIKRGRLPGVARIIAVGSGKGGVGKSTVAANLALALQLEGLRVGLIDADIYGPSIPMILGVEDGARQVKMTPERKILPLQAHGLAVVSFGFFLGPESPAIWRGALVSKAVKQFSRGVLWPELDVLVVDLPPGTGDVPLSLAQAIEVDGAVVVTTPQRLSVHEAEKAVNMFRKLEVPVLGVVENMSYALCDCGRRSHPFGMGGGGALASRAGVPLLAQLPFEESVVEGQDRGAPPVVEHPRSAVAAAFHLLAANVLAELGFMHVEANQPALEA